MTDGLHHQPDPGLVADFLVEAREHLVTIESLILALESSTQNEDGSDSIPSLFRAFHTLKGMAGFLEVTPMQTLAHEVETLLTLVRDGRLPCISSILDLVLASTDILRQQLGELEGQTGVASPPDDLLRRIREATLGDLLLPATCLEAPASEAPTPPEVPAIPRAIGGEAGTLRVETAKLDRLLNLAGELAVAQSQLRQQLAFLADEDASVTANFLQLSRLTRQVQAAAQALRLVSMGPLFQRSARLVRDLSRHCGKEVVLEVAGEETELDKRIAERLSDPLLHMIRNAIDHGIETPAEREAAGKPLRAILHLAAYHRTGQIVIEVSDDGRGLNRTRILEKALERGVVDPLSASSLTDAEVYRLIFEPGFSTAAHLTELSGRGVGMDIVRAQVEQLQGHVEIRSSPGRGTGFLLRFPLTLAVLDALIVVAAGQRYLLPVATVRRIFQPTPQMLSSEDPGAGSPGSGSPETVQFEDRRLPILRLHRHFGTTGPGQMRSPNLLIAVEAAGTAVCIEVDELAGRQDVIIKSLGPLFTHVSGLSGCAILGDGCVGLIIDAVSLRCCQPAS